MFNAINMLIPYLSVLHYDQWQGEDGHEPGAMKCERWADKPLISLYTL
jgi:hypothetical protein